MANFGGITGVPQRCAWCTDDPIYRSYHDYEWGVPQYDDHTLFEFLVLEGAQAGLSWLTILKKRAAYRQAFDQFDIGKVASYTEADVARLMANPGIVRNRLKIASAIRNAQAIQRIQTEFGSFSAFLWRYVEGVPQRNAWPSLATVPTTTPVSKQLSRDLKQRGCNFVGPTICYAFMQAVGMVNDHTTDCFLYKS